MTQAEQHLVDMVAQAGGKLDYATIYANTPHPHKDRLHATVNGLRASGKIKRYNVVNPDDKTTQTMIELTGV